MRNYFCHTVNSIINELKKSVNYPFNISKIAEKGHYHFHLRNRTSVENVNAIELGGVSFLNLETKVRFS